MRISVSPAGDLSDSFLSILTTFLTSESDEPRIVYTQCYSCLRNYLYGSNS